MGQHSRTSVVAPSHRATKIVVVIVGVFVVTSHMSGGQSRTLSIAATPASRDLRDWDRRVDQMIRAGDLRVRESHEDALMPGRILERFDQFAGGVRVFGGDIARQSDRLGTISLFGVLYDGIDIDTRPNLSPEEARDVVSRAEGGVSLGGPLPELLIVPLDDGEYVLAYRCQAVTPQGAWAYFVDALKGTIRLKRDLLETQSAVVTGTGVLRDTKKVSVDSVSGTYVADDMLRPPSLRTYDMRGNLTLTFSVLNGVTPLGTSNLASDSSTTWTDGPNVDAHTYEGYTYDFYFKRFGRRGLDNHDARIVGITHPVNVQDVFSATGPVVGTFYINAFYCPPCGTDGKGMMVYGVGLPNGVSLRIGSTLVGVRNFAAALDVVGHELTHGVTAFSSNLDHVNEAGALNEAFSDMMGTSVEFFVQPAGSGTQKADYLTAEDIISPPIAPLVRSLQDPQAFGTPDHYSNRLTDAFDNGEVHANSTIASHAFYLAIEGGTNRTSGVSVQGVGAANRDQIEKVFYRGFTSLLPSNATFSMARAATIQSARDLYGGGSAVERAVAQAWTAVGVD